MKSLDKQSNNLAEVSPDWHLPTPTTSPPPPPPSHPHPWEGSEFLFLFPLLCLPGKRNLPVMQLGLVKPPLPLHPALSSSALSFHIPGQAPDPWEAMHLPDFLTPPLSPQGAPHCPAAFRVWLIFPSHLGSAFFMVLSISRTRNNPYRSVMAT